MKFTWMVLCLVLGTFLCTPVFANSTVNSPVMTVIVQPGSLKANVQRIIHLAGWNQLVWSVPFDYNWVGQVQIQGKSVQSILQKVLANYPLQAVFYQGNHVVLIKTR